MEAYKGYENPQLVISAEELKGTLDDKHILHRGYANDLRIYSRAYSRRASLRSVRFEPY